MRNDPLRGWNGADVPRSEREARDEDVFASLDPAWPGLEPTLAAYRERRMDDAKRELLAYFRRRERPQWFFEGRGAAEAEFRPEALLGISGSDARTGLAEGAIADAMADADRLVRGQFLGGVLHDLGERRDRFPLFDLNGEDDKPLRVTANRFVRMNFVKPLVFAYYRTRKPIYAEALAAILKAFAEKLLEEHPYVPDPPESAEAYTIHFSRSPFRSNMSVAQSALNLIDLLHTGLFDSEWLPTRLSFRLFRYAWYVMGYHRTYDRNRYRHYNHHLFERGMAPIAFSVLFPEFPHLRPMLERGMAVVDAHFEHDYHESGGYDEHSLAYTCKTTLSEFLFPIVRLLELNGMGDSCQAWRDKLGQVCTYYSGLVMPDGRFPDVGDAGGGAAKQLLVQGAARFGSRSAQAVLEALGLAGREHEERDDAGSPESEPLSASPSLPPNGRSTAQHTPHAVGKTSSAPSTLGALRLSGSMTDRRPGDSANALPPLAKGDPPTGYLWARDRWAPDGSYMLMCNKIFTRHCAHNHVDMLSLILAVRGETLIGEPLARTLYKYVSNGSTLDEYLRGLGSHNTVLVHGQAVTKPMLQRERRMDGQTVRTEAFESLDDAVYARASHQADPNGSHTREVLFAHGVGWLIVDTVGITRAGNGQPHVQRWHLEHGVTVERVETDVGDGDAESGALLLRGRSSRLLCVWSERSAVTIRLWKQEAVLAIGSVPDYKSATDLPWIVDVSFRSAEGVHAADGSRSRLPCLFLDVTHAEEPLSAIVTRCRRYLSDHWERLLDAEKPALEGAACSASLKKIMQRREEAR